MNEAKAHISSQAVDLLRERAAELLRAQSEDGWRSWAWGEPSHQAELYARYPGLFSAANLRHVERAHAEPRSGAEAEEREALQLFQLYLEREIIGQRLAPLQDEITNAEAAASAALPGGGTAPFRQVAVLLSNEDDAVRRRALFTACDPVYERLNPLRLRALQLMHAGARELGYPDYTAMGEAQRLADFKALGALAASVLRETNELYAQLLAEERRRELGPGPFTRADTARLMRSRAFDAAFPPERMEELLKTTLQGLGIELERQPNILLDLEARPQKVPRAVMFAIDAPGDIRLSVKPVGGSEDYAALFHEMGHAQHFAHTTEHAWEFRNVGASNAVTELFAFLFEHLLDDPAWLELHTSMSAGMRGQFARSRAFRRLFLVRRYCAKLQYELALHDDAGPGTAELAARYAATLSAALHYESLPSEPMRYLADVDELFYAADYLRAWLMEAQLVRHFRERYGRQWFASAECGAELHRLWGPGQRYGAADFMRIFGLPPLSATSLLQEVAQLARG